VVAQQNLIIGSPEVDRQENYTASSRSTTVVDSGTEVGLEENTLVDESYTESNDGPHPNRLLAEPVSVVAEITLPVTVCLSVELFESEHIICCVFLAFFYIDFMQL